MKQRDQLHEHQRSISEFNLRFLDFVDEKPEALDRSSFSRLERPNPFFPYPMQSWPTFVSRQNLDQIKHISLEMCRLMRSIPIRVFGADPVQLERFYQIDRHAAEAVATMCERDPARIQSCLARPDFVYTRAGFQCLECNIASNLGGWQADQWASAHLEVPLVRQFCEEQGIVPGWQNVLQRLLEFIVAEVKERFDPVDETVNLAFMFPDVSPVPKQFSQLINEEYRKVLAAEGITYGQLFVCEAKQLGERGGLYFGDHQIHAAIEGFTADSTATVTRCWLKGQANIYNGPFSSVLSDKRNLGLLSELASEGELDAGENEFVQKVVPWTRQVARTTTRYQGNQVSLPDLLCDQQARFVLKSNQSASGSDVHIGHSTPVQEWVELVRKGLEEEPYLVQEYLNVLPFPYQHGFRGTAPHRVIWSFFVFGDRYGGSFLRFMPQDQTEVVSARRGAQVGTIFEVEN